MDSLILFIGEKDVLVQLENELHALGYPLITYTPATSRDGWVEKALQVGFALLSSAVLTNAISEYIKSRKIEVVLTSEGNLEKLICDQRNLKKIINMFSDLKPATDEKEIPRIEKPK